MNHEQLKAAFEKLYGPGPVRMVVSPGRVNLIGEHTDYNDGFVCPMAIEPSVIFAFRKRDDSMVRVKSTTMSDEVCFDLQQPITPIKPKEHWGNYVRGMTHHLQSAGVPLAGIDVLLDATLPPGSGLSSSAAMEMGMGTALLAAAGEELDRDRLALLGQRAEHTFPLVKCGIMDQMIVANGRRDHAMLLDCRSLEKQWIPLDGRDLRIVIVHSGVGHSLAADENRLDMPDGFVAYGSPYNMRRLACETGVAAIRARHPQVKALRDVTMDMLDEAAIESRDDRGHIRFKPGFNEPVYMRCRHVITEIERCVQFAAAMRDKSYEKAGQLMYESHRSLMIDYEVSIGPLDVLVTLASSVKGVYGARMTGAGFGGCIVAMMQPGAVDAFRSHIETVYPKLVGKTPRVISTTATEGAHVVA